MTASPSCSPSSHADEARCPIETQTPEDLRSASWSRMIPYRGQQTQDLGNAHAEMGSHFAGVSDLRVQFWRLSGRVYHADALRGECARGGHMSQPRSLHRRGLEQGLHIEENTGSGWKIVSSPGLTTGLGSRLYGVACATPGRCIAVGQTQDLASRSKTLILENAGNSWTIVPSPNAIAFGLDTGRLVGIACPRPADCLAVGGYEVETGNYHTLIEENAGQGWEVITSPNAERGDSDLSQITCPTATQCLAVGSIAVENNGQGWVVGTYPTKGSLSAVSCVASERCIGVGGESLGGFPPVLAPLIFDKSDQNWTISSEGGVLGWLNSVTCQTANHCIAVGENDSYGALIEEQRGEGWKIVDTSTFAGNVKLSGVTCPDESSSALGLAFAHDLKDCLHLAAERSKSLTSASPANDDQRQPRSEAARRLRTGRVLVLSHQRMTQLLKAASGKGKHFHGRGIRRCCRRRSQGDRSA